MTRNYSTLDEQITDPDLLVMGMNNRGTMPALRIIFGDYPVFNTIERIADTTVNTTRTLLKPLYVFYTKIDYALNELLNQ